VYGIPGVTQLGERPVKLSLEHPLECSTVTISVVIVYRVLQALDHASSLSET